ncbi:hypothetical protein [Spirosoma areae]
MKNNLAFLALFLLSLTPALAQHQHGSADHKHASSHGGIVKSAGNYHLELVQKNGMLTVYLLDANQKTLPTTGASATALLQTPDGRVTTAKLTSSGKEQFTATLDKTKPFHKAVINVTIGGQSASASFDLMPIKSNDGHAAQHH